MCRPPARPPRPRSSVPARRCFTRPRRAAGAARAAGGAGVCTAPSGPGATNLVTGLATAQLDSIPVVAITGKVPAALIGKDAFQEIDITGITLPLTTDNHLVRTAA